MSWYPLLFMVCLCCMFPAVTHCSQTPNLALQVKPSCSWFCPPRPKAISLRKSHYFPDSNLVGFLLWGRGEWELTEAQMLHSSISHCWVKSRLFVVSRDFGVGYFGWFILWSPLAKADEETTWCSGIRWCLRSVKEVSNWVRPRSLPFYLERASSSLA